MSIKQLFKPGLFADNLLTIQMFIQSPSHKQMKSNKPCRESTHFILIGELRFMKHHL